MEFYICPILLFTSFVCEAVDKVRNLTGDVVLARVPDGHCSSFKDVSKSRTELAH